MGHCTVAQLAVSIVILTLTLGIGANTAIFTLLYQALLRPLPYPDAGRLVFVWNTYALMGLPQASVSIPDYIDRKTQAPAIEDATLFTGQRMTLAEEGRPEQLRALAVTPSFFSTLRRQPFLGRAFTEEEARPGADRFAILTHALWVSHFGGDPGIVNRDVRMNGEPYRVVGVLPADFDLPARDISALVPFSFTPEQMSDNGRGNEFSSMIARLATGATIDQLNAQMKTIVDRNLDRLPNLRGFAKTSGFGGYAIDMRQQLVQDVRTPLFILQVGVVLLLLIACANVANLLLMRATGRGRELAIRTTLGAGQWRLVRQMVVEGLVLSAIGSVFGLALGLAGVRGLMALSSRGIPGVTGVSLDPAILVFTMALAAATGVVFGVVPAVAVIRGNVASMLKEDSTRGSATRRTGLTRTVLVIAETAIAVMLLVGAGLLIKSFVRLQDVNPGFSSDNVLTAQLALPSSRYADATARRIFWERLTDRIRALPGVTAAGLTTNVPFNGNVSSGSYSIVGYTPGPSEAAPHGRQEIVGGDYFRAMQIPLIEGRVFNDGDTADSPRVVVVDQYMANRYFAGRSAIGHQIQRGGPDSPKLTIVGVVGTINSIDLGMPVAKERIYQDVRQVTAGPDGGRPESRRRSGDARGAAPRGGPVDRSRAADLGREDDGSVDWPFARDAARADAAALAVRHGGDAALGYRHLRRPCLWRRAARTGVRDQAGARSGQPGDPDARAGAGTEDGRSRCRARACGIAGVVPLPAEPALRRGRARPVGIRRRHGAPCRRRDCRVLFPGAPRDACRSDGCAARRVSYAEVDRESPSASCRSCISSSPPRSPWPLRRSAPTGRRVAISPSRRPAAETTRRFTISAWRAIQKGPKNDPALMLMLARAQSLSGRPGDALVMLERLADKASPPTSPRTRTSAAFARSPAGRTSSGAWRPSPQPPKPVSWPPSDAPCSEADRTADSDAPPKPAATARTCRRFETNSFASAAAGR